MFVGVAVTPSCVVHRGVAAEGPGEPDTNLTPWGTFSDPGAVTVAGNGASVTGGQLVFAAGTGAKSGRGLATQAFEVGRTYSFAYDIVSRTSGTVSLAISAGNTPTGGTIAGPGSAVGTITGTVTLASAVGQYVRANISSGGVAVVDNVRVELALSALTLSANTVAEDASDGTPIGALGRTYTGSTLSLTDDAGGKFSIDPDGTIRKAGALDYETATSHNITVRETKAGVANSPRDTVLNIGVANNATDDPVILQDLTLSSDTVAEDATVGTAVGAVQQTSPGSTVTLFDNAGGLFALDNGVIEVAGALDYETATSHNITLRETHPLGTNSPHDTVLAIAVGNVQPTLAALVWAGTGTSTTTISTGGSPNLGNTSIGTVVGASSGLALTDDSLGRFGLEVVNSGVVRVVTTGPTPPGSYTIEITQTDNEATNSPRVSELFIEVTS